MSATTPINGWYYPTTAEEFLPYSNYAKVVTDLEDALSVINDLIGPGIDLSTDWNGSVVASTIAVDISTGRGILGAQGSRKASRTTSVVRLTTADGLAASTTKYIWRKPDNTFAVTATNSAPVSGSLLLMKVTFDGSQATTIDNNPQGRQNAKLLQEVVRAPFTHLNTINNNGPAFVALTTTTAWAAANRAILSAVKPQKDVTISKMSWVSSLQSGNYDIGIYDDLGNKLWSLGSTAWPAGGTQTPTVSPSLDLKSGRVYWFAFACDNATARLGQINLGTVEQSRALDGTYQSIYFASQFPLPSTLNVASGGTSNTAVPWIAART